MRGTLRRVQEAPETQPTRQRRLLLVADAHNDRRALAIALRVQGHVAVEVDDARDARAHVERTPYDLAVVDARLGDLTGAAIARDLEAASPRLAIVLLAEHTFPSELRAPRELRRTRVMQKPLQATDILSLINGEPLP